MIENFKPSRNLTVYLHGLGYTAEDFRPTIALDPTHTIAISTTNTDLADLTRYISRLHVRYSKRITLVGFSLGADTILRLTETMPDYADHFDGVLLLDPNINRSTMAISGVLADANPTNPVPAMKRVLSLADNQHDFADLCAYLGTIGDKDFGPIARQADDFWDWWKPDGDYSLFVDRMRALIRKTRRVRVVFSKTYEPHMERLRREFANDPVDLRIHELNHFGLIGDDFLRSELVAVRL